MDVVVELVEGLLHLRVSADLRSHRDQPMRCLDEMAMVRRIDEHARWISQHRAGAECDEKRCRSQGEGKSWANESASHAMGTSCRATTGTRFSLRRPRVSGPRIKAIALAWSGCTPICRG